MRADHLRGPLPIPPRQADRLPRAGVRDANQNRHATVHLPADALNHFSPQLVAEARGFTRGTQGEHTMHATGQDVLDQTFQGRVIHAYRGSGGA